MVRWCTSEKWSNCCLLEVPTGTKGCSFKNRHQMKLFLTSSNIAFAWLPDLCDISSSLIQKQWRRTSFSTCHSVPITLLLAAWRPWPKVFRTRCLGISFWRECVRLKLLNLQRSLPYSPGAFSSCLDRMACFLNFKLSCAFSLFYLDHVVSSTWNLLCAVTERQETHERILSNPEDEEDKPLAALLISFLNVPLLS